MRATTYALTSWVLLVGACMVGTDAETEDDPDTGGVIGPDASAKRPVGKLAPATGALFGAFVDPDNHWSGNALEEGEVAGFETTIGRKLDIDHHFYAWTDTFPSGLEQWDIAQGRIPLISWQGTDLGQITSGAFDAMIATRAKALKALGTGVFLRWGWEMNGNWSTWDGTHNNSPGQTNGPSKYIAAYRYIHDIFVANGATNVVWVWCPNGSSVPDLLWNHWTKYYPGTRYVDWVGIDAYNWGTTQSWSSWMSFSKLFGPVYQDYKAVKPVIVAETASAEAGGSKAAWIKAARSVIKTSFPSIAAVVWFDANKEVDWRVDSSATSLAAYKSMGADTYFRTRP